MAEDKVFKEQCQTECTQDCPVVYDFIRLTDEMINTIISLEEELVRWRQVLIKYLPPDWADGLQQDIFNNISRGFEGDPAYDIYVKLACNGIDPQQDAAHVDLMQRLAEGTDPTSITYL